MLCFVLINGILLNLLRVWILQLKGVFFFSSSFIVSSKNIERLYDYTQHANFRGKTLFQAIKQQLNHTKSVKNETEGYIYPLLVEV